MVVPLKLSQCKVEAQLEHGCSHFVTMPRGVSLPNRNPVHIDNETVASIVLLGVPRSIRGPYELSEPGDFSNAGDVRIEGPFETSPGSQGFAFAPTKWTLRITTGGPAGANGTQVQTAQLRLNPFFELSMPTLEHFDRAWSQLRDELSEKQKSVDEAITQIQTARKLLDPALRPGPDNRRGGNDSGNESEADSDAEWERRRERFRDEDSD